MRKIVLSVSVSKMWQNEINIDVANEGVSLYAKKIGDIKDSSIVHGAKKYG